MSSAEWQEPVLARLKAGAIGEELWGLISSARIKDADVATLESQREMEKLTAVGATRIKLMLEANHSLRDEGALTEFMRLFRAVGTLIASMHRCETGRSKRHRV
jgi:hypothetical protein